MPRLVLVLDSVVDTVDRFESVVDNELDTLVKLVLIATWLLLTLPRLVETFPRLVLIATWLVLTLPRLVETFPNDVLIAIWLVLTLPRLLLMAT